MRYVVFLFLVLGHITYGENQFTEEEKVEAIESSVSIIVPNQKDHRLIPEPSENATKLPISAQIAAFSIYETFTTIAQYLDKDSLRSLDQTCFEIHFKTRSYIKDVLLKTAKQITPDQSIGQILHQLSIGYKIPQCSYINESMRTLFGVLNRFNVHSKIPYIKLLHDVELPSNMRLVAEHFKDHPNNFLVVDTGYGKLGYGSELKFSSTDIPNNTKNLVLLNMSSNVNGLQDGSLRSHNSLEFLELFLPEASMIGKAVLAENKKLKTLILNMPNLFSVCPEFLQSCTSLERVDTYLTDHGFSNFYFFNTYNDFNKANCSNINMIIVSHEDQKKMFDDGVNKKLTKKISVVVRETVSQLPKKPS